MWYIGSRGCIRRRFMIFTGIEKLIIMYCQQWGEFGELGEYGRAENQGIGVFRPAIFSPFLEKSRPLC